MDEWKTGGMCLSRITERDGYVQKDHTRTTRFLLRSDGRQERRVRYGLAFGARFVSVS